MSFHHFIAASQQPLHKRRSIFGSRRSAVTVMVGFFWLLVIHSMHAVAASSVVGTWNISGKSTATAQGQRVSLPLAGKLTFKSNGTFVAAPGGFTGSWKQTGNTIKATPSDKSVKSSLVKLFRDSGLAVTVDSVRSAKSSLTMS